MLVGQLCESAKLYREPFVVIACPADPGAQVKEVAMDDVPGLEETNSVREELDEGLSAFFER